MYKSVHRKHKTQNQPAGRVGYLAIFVDKKREIVALDMRKSTLLMHDVTKRENRNCKHKI